MESQENNPKKSSLQKEWLQMWSEFEKEFAKLPDWAQQFLIRDMKAAFKDRIALIKKIETQPIYRKNFNQPPNENSMVKPQKTREEL